MKKIMLVCRAGLSTSLLVERVRTAVSDAGDEIEVFASADTKMTDFLDDVDCIILTPMVHDKLAMIEGIIHDKELPVVCGTIDLKDYSMMNGEAIYRYAKELLQKM